MDCANISKISECIKIAVVTSLVLQFSVYFIAPLRKRIRSKLRLGFISIIFSLGKLIPACNLMIICTFAVFNHDHCNPIDGRTTTLSLLNWASLMLLHIVGHGQERETPHPLHLSVVTNNYSCKVIVLEFLFYLTVFVIAFLFLFELELEQELLSIFAFVLLACTRTFHKLNQGDHKQITTDHEKYVGNPVVACRKVVDDLKLDYCNFYGGVPPSLYEVFIITVPLMTLSPKLAATTFLITCVSLCLPLLFNNPDEKFNYSFFLMAVSSLIIEVRLFKTSNSSTIFVLSVTTTYFLLAFPITKKYLSAQVCSIDDYQWSRTIPQFNLLAYSLFRKPSKLSTSINYILSTWSLSGNEKYEDKVGEYIFTELRSMIVKQSNDGSMILDTTSIIAAKGLWVLKQKNYQDLIDCEATFEERVIQWHFATTILYHTRQEEDDNGRSFNSYLSKVLSDYMGYLLIVQPWIMSKQRGIVLKTCLKMWVQVSECCATRGHYSTQKLSPQTVVEEIITNLDQDQTKTALKDAPDLAKNLESKLKDEKERWSFILRVWVEMLAYASIRCNTMDHIQGLVQGGELSTIIWRLMLSLGFKEQ